jgi:hypothetical protein
MHLPHANLIPGHRQDVIARKAGCNGVGVREGFSDDGGDYWVFELEEVGQLRYRPL